MKIELWLKRDDINRFEEICNDADLRPYCTGDIYSGILKNSGKLSKVRKSFVLGRLDGNNEVLLLNNSYYGKKGIKLSQSKHSGGILLLGGDGDIVKSTFLTYYSDSVKKTSKGKPDERNNHFVLYSVF
ncbi:MAG: hypothetical protein WA139_03425 [Candidatus Aenigmatarchaeota archaeon]